MRVIIKTKPEIKHNLQKHHSQTMAQIFAILSQTEFQSYVAEGAMTNLLYSLVLISLSTISAGSTTLKRILGQSRESK